MLVCKCGADVTFLDTGCLQITDVCLDGYRHAHYARCVVCGRLSSTPRLSKEAAISDWYDEHSKVARPIE